jgi:beta-lactam-binding protein with PASTA domain
MSLVLVTVGVMSALTAMRVAIHGREVTVPNFVKMSPPEAERLADRSGLAVGLEGQFYSTDVPEGRIVSQQPPAGTRVRRGWRVSLAQSLGAQRVPIPDVEGQSPRAAELNVRQRGLELDAVAQAHIPEAPQQQVIAQSPPANAVGISSPKISVLVADEPKAPTFVTPRLVGRSLADATALIQQGGFRLGTVTTTLNATATAPNADAGGTLPPNSIVLKQSPSPGQRIGTDAVFDLEIRQ